MYRIEHKTVRHPGKVQRAAWQGVYSKPAELKEQMTRFLICNSLADLIDAAEHAARIDRTAEEAACDSVRRGSWIGRYDLTESTLYAAARTGWPEGSDKYRRMMARIDATDEVSSTVVRRRRCRSDSDGEVNTDRVFSPADDIYDDFRREKASAPLGDVTVVCGVGGMADLSPTQMLWRAVGAAALASKLTDAGYRVSVLGVHATLRAWTDTTDRLVVGCWVKQPGDPLHGDAMVSALSGWCTRTLWFLAKHAPNLGNHTSDDYGTTGESGDDDLEVLGVPAGSRVIRVRNLYTEDGIVGFINAQLAALKAGTEVSNG